MSGHQWSNCPQCGFSFRTDAGCARCGAGTEAKVSDLLDMAKRSPGYWRESYALCENAQEREQFWQTVASLYIDLSAAEDRADAAERE